MGYIARPPALLAQFRALIPPRQRPWAACRSPALHRAAGWKHGREGAGNTRPLVCQLQGFAEGEVELVGLLQEFLQFAAQGCWQRITVGGEAPEKNARVAGFDGADVRLEGDKTHPAGGAVARDFTGMSLRVWVGAEDERLGVSTVWAADHGVPPSICLSGLPSGKGV